MLNTKTLNNKVTVAKSGNALIQAKENLRPFFKEYGIGILSIFGILFFSWLGSWTGDKFGTSLFMFFEGWDMYLDYWFGALISILFISFIVFKILEKTRIIKVTQNQKDRVNLSLSIMFVLTMLMTTFQTSLTIIFFDTVGLAVMQGKIAKSFVLIQLTLFLAVILWNSYAIYAKKNLKEKTYKYSMNGILALVSFGWFLYVMSLFGVGTNGLSAERGIGAVIKIAEDSSGGTLDAWNSFMTLVGDNIYLFLKDLGRVGRLGAMPIMNDAFTYFLGDGGTLSSIIPGINGIEIPGINILNSGENIKIKYNKDMEFFTTNFLNEINSKITIPTNAGIGRFIAPVFAKVAGVPGGVNNSAIGYLSFTIWNTVIWTTTGFTLVKVHKSKNDIDPVILNNDSKKSLTTEKFHNSFLIALVIPLLIYGIDQYIIQYAAPEQNPMVNVPSELMILIAPDYVATTWYTIGFLSNIGLFTIVLICSMFSNKIVNQFKKINIKKISFNKNKRMKKSNKIIK